VLLNADSWRLHGFEGTTRPARGGGAGEGKTVQSQ
jgi:hypothetical protein